MFGDSLKGYSILVIEDDFYLADEVRQTLEDAGARVIGPTGSPQEALRLLSYGRPDCAVVDVNLGHGPNFDTPANLKSQSVPFVITSGYDDGIIPSAFTDVPRLGKPIDPAVLVQTVRKLLEEANSSGSIP